MCKTKNEGACLPWLHTGGRKCSWKCHKTITIPLVFFCLRWMYASGGLAFAVTWPLRSCFLSFNVATILCSCHWTCISGNCEYRRASGINNGVKTVISRSNWAWMRSSHWLFNWITQRYFCDCFLYYTCISYCSLFWPQYGSCQVLLQKLTDDITWLGENSQVVELWFHLFSLADWLKKTCGIIFCDLELPNLSASTD